MRILFLLALVVLFATVLAITDEEREFQEFQKTYFKTYSTSEEYNYRLEVFRKNLKKAKELDAKDHSASYGVTKFSDLTEEEFRSTYLMRNFKSPLMRGEEVPVWEATFPQDMPTSYDWTTKGVVTPVYNQAQCGSCWAFSTTESIESMNFLAGNTLTSLSMQQIVDCDTKDDGCNGGNPPTAYEYVIGAGGLETYANYPYTAKDGSCKFEKSKVAQTIDGWKYVTRDRDEKAMQAFTYTSGPPSVCVDASTWDSYRGGVYTRADCGTQLDHCVQIVGWTVVKSLNAWIVRNSWGKSWGNEGYLYVAMGQDACGIAQECTSAQVTKASIH